MAEVLDSKLMYKLQDFTREQARKIQQTKEGFTENKYFWYPVIFQVENCFPVGSCLQKEHVTFDEKQTKGVLCSFTQSKYPIVS